MEIKVFCQNCHVEILRADTDTLKTPLVGSMFQVKKDMEWSLFSPYDTGFDLTCPMCEWTFHENGKVKVAVGDDFVFGMPEVIIPGILGFYEEAGEITEEAWHKISEVGSAPEVNGESIVQVVKPEISPPPEGEALNQAIFLVGEFERYFAELDSGGKVSHEKLKLHMEYTRRVLLGLTPVQLKPEDITAIIACLDKDLNGRLSEYFTEWQEFKDIRSMPQIGFPIQKQVETASPEEKTDVSPEISHVQDIVEGKQEEGPGTPEEPNFNHVERPKTPDTDEDSEMNGQAPPGTEATEPQAQKSAKKKGGRPKGAKNKGRKYQKRKH